ncbi:MULTISPECIES: hypothetical protein [Modicisalibacter]|uniref:hypothetical protein n=1 Tax=Modicisalibacter TaxID=574347 RepID=UPI00100AA933|nr:MULTISPECIES: hypothetical protein [Halomonadaceae]MBZ9556761.1 hypothetical protein [Modicisalibacter sp. R2A 31.J]MBZ9574770.1 hypothetical protein [Modicisalibacter sp. MOD 31.J]
MGQKSRVAVLSLVWLIALASAPYTTLMLLEFDPRNQPQTLIAQLHLVPIGMVVLNAMLFFMAFAMTRLCDEIAKLERHREHDDHEPPTQGIDESGNTRNAVLKILRLGKNSPLRGRITERALICSINDVAPRTAAEANQALVDGINEVEWLDARGALHKTRFSTHQSDLLAQFEQVASPRDTSAAATGDRGMSA